MHILLTRPEKQARLTAARLEALGHRCTIEPLLRIEHIAETRVEGLFDGILLTSTNATPFLKQQQGTVFNSSTPVLTTGEATRQAALQAGFTNVETVKGGALELVEATPQWMKNKHLTPKAHLLYPCARKTAHDLHDLLNAQAINCTALPVYHAVPVNKLTKTTRHALKDCEFDGVFLYSPRTARAFARLAGQFRNLPRLYALSKDIKSALPAAMQENCVVSQFPDESSLLELLT